MKTLYLECNMGAAGDMLMAALSELVPDTDKFIEKMNALGLEQVTVTREPSVKCGITGTHVSVTVAGREEESTDVHEHGEHHHHHHEHVHSHHHASMHDMEHVVSELQVSDKVKKDVIAVYRLIAEAESHAHGRPVEEIHFHEVGTMDAVADITGVCMLMEEIAPERIIVSPVHVGSGQVSCAHGILPVPAPATAYILQGVPIYGGEVKGELCTPTGAALLKYFADSFGNMPVMRVSKIGYGMGKKDFEAANCVRAVLGETDEYQRQMTDEVVELSCNLDDMTPEAIGFAQEMLWEAGAVDVFTTAIGMKKNRPGIMLTCLCSGEREKEVAAAMFRHTTTLGIRRKICSRYVLERRIEQKETEFGTVTVKKASGYGVSRKKAEYEELAQICRECGLSMEEVKKRVWHS